ncbi:bifunctional methylenetetrahydrofolate dehydrogenase/methenyltetrahydrofolate cyclohydrolase FolD [Alkalicoccus luteus]|uniref:Bifunctional protein FolD n=1 Tax=Alkalicoccus luteus TaxID=1237094 RepID=A0A969PRE4_9BACI|nr:bifunctional methylenetetrahydrofolate dehydrogenase/methenyltetrahydrofolate cyclohydrolase FolD [Alkalicoccus luteus]NJP37634.1 bifunctional methylenetetrahydrofolate dehydrogenase/methenyltetrahydrofolate cyclohydrolase FolD [Alkalicoccus luteus]
MGAEVISGKELAQATRQSLKERTEELVSQGITPGLGVILVGNDPASASYVRGKEKACLETGIHSEVDRPDESITEEELLGKIDTLNNREDIHGILVQLPLPSHIDEQKVIMAIDPSKDVDGFHPYNTGKMLTGDDGFLPCTPFGIIHMLKSRNIPIEGRHAVVVGRSNIVGKPAGMLLLKENATVTFCHSRTKDMRSHTKQADILIAAVGKEKFISADDIKAGAVVVDVGVNRTSDGKLAGDVDFESVKEKASFITPVPGGVGPMTITMLMYNTVISAEKRLHAT